jgi:hypothetical protein
MSAQISSCERPPTAISSRHEPECHQRDEKLNYNFIHDIAPVAGIDCEPNVMEVHLSVPARRALEFIAYAKANSGKINFASGGIGTSQHVSGEASTSFTCLIAEQDPRSPISSVDKFRSV